MVQWLVPLGFQVIKPGVVENESSNVRLPLSVTEFVGTTAVESDADKVGLLLTTSVPVPSALLVPMPSLPALSVSPPSYVPSVELSEGLSANFPAPFLTMRPPPVPVIQPQNVSPLG